MSGGLCYCGEPGSPGHPPDHGDPNAAGLKRALRLIEYYRVSLREEKSVTASAHLAAYFLTRLERDVRAELENGGPLTSVQMEEK